MSIHVVAGPPGSGKTTYALERMVAGEDLLLDFDAVRGALTQRPEHELTPTLDRYVQRAVYSTQDIIQYRLEQGDSLPASTWITRGLAKADEREQLAKDLGAQVIVLETPLDTCLERIDARDISEEAKAEQKAAARRWWSDYEPRGADQVVKDEASPSGRVTPSPDSSHGHPAEGGHMKRLYEVRAAADDVAEIWLYGEIGPDYWGDGSTIDAKTFAQDLAEIEASQINLRINSPGGSVSHSQAIYNALLRHPAKVTSFVDGIAASGASLVALAGDEVVMAENALYMVHDPAAFLFGFYTSATLRQEADVNDKYAETIIRVYARKTGLSHDEIAAIMDAETWYTADEALDAGFIDRVSADGNASDLIDIDRLQRMGYRNMPAALLKPMPAAAAQTTPEPPEDRSGDIDPTLATRAAELLTRPRHGGR